MATHGASLTPSNGANVCGASLSSMRDQLKNDLNINNSPKAMTTNSHLSHEKQNKNLTSKHKMFQSSANAKTLNEKLQILH